MTPDALHACRLLLAAAQAFERNEPNARVRALLREASRAAERVIAAAKESA